MDSDVAALAAESGPLRGVSGILDPGGLYRSLEFDFASGILALGCDDDTDELIVEIHDGDPVAPLVSESWAQSLLGKWIEHAWELRNHRGYCDAFQLRLMDNQRRCEIRQFEVAASTIEVRRVEPGCAAT